MTVETTGTIDSPIEDVWAVVGDFGGLMKWHPHLESCQVEEVDGALERRVRFKGGDRWAVERLIKLDPQAHYLEYTISDAQDRSMIGLGGDITLSPTPEGGTTVRWIAARGRELPEDAKAQLVNYYSERIGHLRSAVSASR